MYARVLSIQLILIRLRGFYLLRTRYSSNRDPPARLQPFDMELDETDDKILVELMWSTMVYMHERKDDVLALKELLLI